MKRSGEENSRAKEQILKNESCSFFKVISRIRNIPGCLEIACNENNQVLLHMRDHLLLGKLGDGVLRIKFSIFTTIRITSLCLSKTAKWFVFGCQDFIIHIWKINQKSIWSEDQQLDEHLNYPKEIILNNDETLMISASWGEFFNLILWKKDSSGKMRFFQNIKNKQFQVRFVSFNVSGNSFVFTHGPNICFWKQNDGLQWSENQTVINQSKSYCQRLHFISDQKLVVSTVDGELLTLLYVERFEILQRFRYCLEGDVSCLGPSMYYNSLLNFLILKHHTQIFIINIENKNCRILQVIDAPYGYYNICEEGKYLIMSYFHEQRVEIRMITSR